MREVISGATADRKIYDAPRMGDITNTRHTHHDLRSRTWPSKSLIGFHPRAFLVSKVAMSAV
jgi:hypothetical protein